ncbi:MAG: hypothetical protein GX316_03140 [Firmicutes bacterium]|nr:hypothetical protein [Bacillota bacterium]
MVQIRIQQKMGRIGIEHFPAQMHMKAELRELKLRQVPSRLEIATRPARIEVDQKESLRDVGLADVMQLGEDATAKSWQVYRRDLSKMVAQGDRMARIEQGGKAVVEIARENTQTHKELNLAAAPKQRPRILGLPGKMHYEYHLGEVEVALGPEVFNYNYIPGSLEIYFLEKPWIKIDTVGNRIDLVA